VIVEGILSEELYIVKPKAMCHFTRKQASMHVHIPQFGTQSKQSSK